MHIQPSCTRCFFRCPYPVRASETKTDTERERVVQSHARPLHAPSIYLSIYLSIYPSLSRALWLSLPPSYSGTAWCGLSSLPPTPPSTATSSAGPLVRRKAARGLMRTDAPGREYGTRLVSPVLAACLQNPKPA
jgi:hypothetical protein